MPLMLFGASDGYAAINIINPTGGLTPTDGLKIFTERGQFIICRNNLEQLYNGNCDNGSPELGDLGIGLQVEDGVVVSGCCLLILATQIFFISRRQLKIPTP
jgi:hypothetical protein